MTYAENPALKPTILVNELTKTIYVPTRLLPPARPDATQTPVARETNRAA